MYSKDTDAPPEKLKHKLLTPEKYKKYRIKYSKF